MHLLALVVLAFVMTSCDKAEPTIHILPWDEIVYEGDIVVLEWKIFDQTLLLERTSTDETIATVDQGIETMLKEGTVTIRVTLQDSVEIPIHSNGLCERECVGLL